MKILRWFPLLLLGLALAVLAACSSGGSGSTGAINVRIGDGPTTDYSSIVLDVHQVQIHSSQTGWITLSTPDKTLDLLTLRGGITESLASGASLPEGSYQQMRLVLGSRNTVTVGGTEHPLEVPSGLQSGVKMPLSFSVVAGTTKDVFIDFDGARSIQVVQAGGSGRYLLRPVVRAYDKVVTGSISGTLKDASTQQGLAGAMVCAEVLDGNGDPSIVRSALTGADGSYTLDLLPVGGSYHVVAMPVAGGTAYVAQASPAIAISGTAPLQTWNGSFSAAASTGGLGGTITPTATAGQSDQVLLLQDLDTGAGVKTFVVADIMATVGSSAETYAMTPVPTGSYGVRCVRTVWNADGSSTNSATAVQSVAVTAGGTATVDISVM